MLHKKFEWYVCITQKVNDCNLHYSSGLEFTSSKSNGRELFMLGVLYDWENTTLNNRQILDKLANEPSFDAVITRLSKYAGQYIIMYKEPDNLFIISDACAQFEIYYDTSFSCFGSQPKLIAEIIAPEPHIAQDAVDFYASPNFFSKKYFVGDTTHFGNIKHLRPNHYIDVKKKAVVRYFPREPVGALSTKEVAKKACRILKGYIKSIAARKKIAIPVTGGYDSRILFLASLSEDCKYFVSQHKNMNENHYDIAVPKRLTQMYGKPFETLSDKDGYEDIAGCIDFPKNIPKAGKYFENHIYLNGGGGEIARSYYGSHDNISSADLAFLTGYGGWNFVEDVYRQWMENAPLFANNGYHILDMFYWEERMGIAGGKAKSMSNAFGVEEFSPFCSHELLTLLLSTPRKDRNKHLSRLYDAMLLEMSPDALKIPINPCLKLNIIKLMTKLKIYGIYQSLGLKYRFLKY